MYNRYIPSAGGYTRVSQEEPPFRAEEPPRRTEKRPPEGGGTADRWLSGLLKGLGLEDLDRGDILLLLILLLLLTDGDELEPVITLGLLLLFSLGGKEHGAEHGTAEESRGGLLI